jgi:simple sugar transport system permease protein
MAVGVALLMIRGEFDLSAGVTVITAALTAAMFSYELSLNLWVGTIIALVLALVIGFWNGWLTMRTGIPSFLITLSTFFMLQGLNLGVTKLLTGTVATTNISHMDGFDALETIFASSFTIGGFTVRITVVWWLLFTALATWLLLRTRVGNWSSPSAATRQAPGPSASPQPGQDRPVHGGRLPGVVLRNAPALRLQHSAVG